MDFKIYEIPANVKNAIYFLIDKDKVVYVGKTKNGLKRLTQHTKKTFDKFGFIEYKEEELDYYEDFYIMKYQPKYNHRYSVYRSCVTGVYSTLSAKIRKYMSVFDFITYAKDNEIELKYFKDILTITKKDFEYLKAELNKKYGVL